MWQIYQCLVLCVTCSVLSSFLLPTSVTLAVVCVCLALLFMLNDYLVWRYFSVHVASIYHWIVSVYNFLAIMYHQSNIANGPVRKYGDNNVASANSIGLYRKNNPNPKYNLISSYSLQSESGLSKSFQSPLKSLRYRPSIDSSVSESSRQENDSKVELYGSNVSRSIQSAGLPSPKYQNPSPVTTRRMETQKETGLLTPSTRFNLNLNPKLYADINSPGFCGRVAEKLNETMTHQSKYSTVGSFPMVNMKNKTPKPHLSHHNSQAVAKTPVRVRVAPPDISLSSLNNSILRHTSIGSDESMKSVLQVLREISRKRIHSQELEEDDDNTKRIRTSEFENVSMEDQPSTDLQAQGKRPREDSPRNEEVKRQRRQVPNNEISSSLSSSVTIQPPHLKLAKKRKAQNAEEQQILISTKEKLLKVQSSPTPPPTPKEEETTASESKKTTKEAMITRVESLHESLVQPITETPNLKKVVPSRISPSPIAKSPTEGGKLIVEVDSGVAPRIFGRFSTAGKVNDVDATSEYNKDGNKNKMNRLKASVPKQQTSRLKDMFSSIEGNDEPDTPPVLKNDQPKTDRVETKMNNFMNNVSKTPFGILSVPSPGEKSSKSVSFSDPIAITKVIIDSESESTSALSAVGEKQEPLNFKTSTQSFIIPKKDGEENKKSGGLSIQPIGSPIVTTTSSLSSGFNLNKVEQSQTFSSPVSITSPTTTVASDIIKPVGFNISSNSSPPPLKSVFSINSGSSANSIFNSSPSTLVNSLSPALQALPTTQASAPTLTSPFAVSSVSASASQIKPLISFGNTTGANSVISSSTNMPVMFASVATTSMSTTTTESLQPAGFSFTPATPKKEPGKALPTSAFGTTTSQSFPLPSGNSIFGNSSIANSSNTSTPANKALFSTSTASETSTKPSFLFGSANPSDTNQNKPMFGTGFGAISSTKTVADKPSIPFGNVFNSASTTQPNTLLSGFGSGNATPTTQSTSMFSPPATSSLQSQGSASVFDSSKTNLQKSENSVNVFGGNASSLEVKTGGFGNSKPASNGFSFTPVATSSSSMFSNVFGASAIAQNTTVSKPTPSFGGFGTTPVTATTAPSLFSFGSATPSNQSNSVFGSGTTTTTTAAPIFNFGSNSTTNSVQSNSVFGAALSTPQTGSPFGAPSAPQSTLAFGTVTPNSTTQTTAFGINSSQKPASGFGVLPNPTQTNPPFCTPTANTAQLTNTAFNTAPAASAFPSLTNGTSTNSTFGGFGAPPTATPFAFGGSAANPSGFSFGGAVSSSSSSVGGFGSGAKQPVMFNTTPAQPVVNTPNVFAFGQTPSASPVSTPVNFQFNAGSSQQSPGGFSFNPNATAPANAFQMGPAAPTPTTMFTLGSGTPRPKAVPRMRRQK